MERQAGGDLVAADRKPADIQGRAGLGRDDRHTRQFICSVLAVGVAVGIYFALQPYVGTEEIGWMCILGAAPFAACGFFTYHGMTAEQVLWAWFKSEILCPKRLVFKSDSYYYEAMQPAIRAGIKRKRGLPMKKNTHDSEETA